MATIPGTAPRHVDWSRVHIDPDKLSPRSRAGYEWLINWMADRLQAQLQSPQAQEVRKWA